MVHPRKCTSTDMDAEKMRDIEAYTHDDKLHTNNLPVHNIAEEQVKTFQFDSYHSGLPSVQVEWYGMHGPVLLRKRQIGSDSGNIPPRANFGTGKLILSLW